MASIPQHELELKVPGKNITGISAHTDTPSIEGLDELTSKPLPILTNLSGTNRTIKLESISKMTENKPILIKVPHIAPINPLSIDIQVDSPGENLMKNIVLS